MTPAHAGQHGPHIAIVTTGWGSKETLKAEMALLRTALDAAPCGDFLVYAIDDGRDESLAPALVETALRYHLPLHVERRADGDGTQTDVLRDAYRSLMDDPIFQPTYLLRLSLDGVRAFGVTLAAVIDAAASGAPVIMGTPAQPIGFDFASNPGLIRIEDPIALAQRRAIEHARIMHDLVRWPEFLPDAPVCHAYEVSALDELLADERVERYSAPTGFETLLALVARGRCVKMAFVPLPLTVECERRLASGWTPDDITDPIEACRCVNAHYDDLVRQIASLVQKPAGSISLWYRNTF